MNEEKKQQVIALGRLGWSLRRIQSATGVRRETAAGYLKEAGVALRPPGGWGRASPAKPANGVITDPALSKPAIEVITDSAGAKPFAAGGDDPDPAKPAIEVTTDFGAELAASAPTAVEPKPGRSPSASACAPYRDAIELGLSRGRNAMAIWQDLVDLAASVAAIRASSASSAICRAARRRKPAP